MITNTSEKLNEAKYFLECMKMKQSDRDAFKYNLSAFLSAARSLTLVMQKEFKHVSGFEEWYAKKRVNMRSDNSMKLLNDKRVMTIHKQPVRPHAHININISEQVSISESISVVITHANGTVEKREKKPILPPTTAKTKVKTEWRWYFNELLEKDVITVCEEHVVKLENLVAECELLHTT